MSGFKFARGTWVSSRSGPMKISCGLTRPNAGCCTWARATPIINPAWGIESNPANLVPKQTCCWPKVSPLAMVANLGEDI